MQKIIKSFSARPKTVNLDQGIFEATISTESTDREGDIVRASGALLDNYRKNAVVLWSHKYDEPPIAKTLEIYPVPGIGIRARFHFSPPGINAMADTVRKLWAGGFLNGASIGFIPLDYKQLPGGGKEYTSYEVLEWSICAIPANSEALRLAMKSFNNGLAIQGKRSRSESLAIQGMQAILEAMRSQTLSEGYFMRLFSAYVDLLCLELSPSVLQKRKPPKHSPFMEWLGFDGDI